MRGALEERAWLEPELRRRDALLHDRLDAQWGDLRVLAGLDRTPARGHHVA